MTAEVIVSSTLELKLPFVSATMNLPPLLQQEVEKWASRQGISSEQFILAAVADRVAALNHQVAEESANEDSEAASVKSPQQPKVFRKEGILVVDAELPKNFDINAFIDELREERIREQMAL